MFHPHPLVRQHYPGSESLDCFLRHIRDCYQQPMYRAAFAVLHDPLRSEEAVRDSFIHIARYPRIQESILLRESETSGYSKAAAAYLWLIADCRAKLHIHRQQALSLDVQPNLASESLTAEERAVLRESVQEVQVFLQQSESINALTLRLIWEGLNHNEIASELAIRPENVRKRIERGRKELVAWLRAQEGRTER